MGPKAGSLARRRLDLPGMIAGRRLPSADRLVQIAQRSVEPIAPYALHSEDADIPMHADARLQDPALPDPRQHALRFT